MVNNITYLYGKIAFCGLFLFLTISCGTESKDKEFLAKVGDVRLYESDLENISTEEERTIFIENWVLTQLYLQEFSKRQLDDVEINKRVADYESSLKKHKIEEKLVLEQLDTVVKDKEIEEFYKNHKSDFELKDFLVRVMYLKVPSNAPDIDKVSKWYLLKNPKDTASMQEYAKLYAVNFYYDDQSWVFFDDILKEVPLRDFDKERFIVRKSNVDFEDNGFSYFLNIYDYRLKDALSPIEFEKEKIKQRIINTRIKKVRKQIEKELLDKAYANKEISIPG